MSAIAVDEMQEQQNNYRNFQRVLQVRRKYCCIILSLGNARGSERMRREEESRCWLEGDDRR